LIKTIQEFFYSRIVVTEETTPVSLEHAQKLATAALLIEISRADFEVADEEKLAIEQALRDSFGISEEETKEIIALAEREVKDSISLYEFTRLVDEAFTPEQKRHIVGLLWQVAFSDDRLQEREEYLIRKIAKLLHVTHADFIDAKLKVKKART
jgi:uncharacterized tellurite resistance protein B-like protein